MRKAFPALAFAVALMLVSMPACGGSGASGNAGGNAEQAAPVLPAAPAQTEAPTAAPSVTNPNGSTDVLTRGEMLYLKTAGGIGCQACHGIDARGATGPNILGKSAETIRVQLESNENMTFIILSDDEIKAIAAYLGFLKAESDAGMDK